MKEVPTFQLPCKFLKTTLHPRLGIIFWNIPKITNPIPNPEFMFRSLKSLQVPTIGIPTSQKYFPI